MFLLLATAALAADLHLEVSTDDWGETIVAPSGEPFTQTFGAPAQGKTKIAYEVTWAPAPHSVVQNGYPLEVTLCRIWAKGKKKDRDCITDTVLAKPEGDEAEPKAGEVKMSAKWTYTMRAFATGDIPSTEMPMEPRGMPEATPVGDVSTE